MVCPQDVKKKMLFEPGWPVGKMGSQACVCEELKEGVWLEPIRAMLRRKTNEAWTDKHRKVTKKLVVEGTWVQKRFFDTGWSDEKKCRDCDEEEGHGEAQAESLSVGKDWRGGSKGPKRGRRIGSDTVALRRIL